MSQQVDCMERPPWTKMGGEFMTFNIKKHVRGSIKALKRGVSYA
ncbi:MAG: hypothetical protein ACP5T2_03395 [Thermoprotei archaeon]